MAAGIRTLLLLVALLAPAVLCASEDIKSIEINGLRYSKERVVLRELPFRQGDEWRETDGYVAERRLRNLGLFSEVSVLPPDHDGVVRIRVKDRWSLWLLPEASRSDGGASSAGFALTEHNLWGLHHNFRLAGRWNTGKNFSSNEGRSYQASYLWRRVADSNYSFDASVNNGRSLYDAYRSGVYQSSYVRDVTSWNSGISYALGPVPGEGWDLRLGFSVSNDSFQLDSGTPLADVQGSRKHALSFSAGYQLIDDQITWLTGSRFNYHLSGAHKSLGSTINVYRQTAGWRRYIDLEQQRVLAVRLQGGLATGDLLNDGLFDIGDGREIRGYFPGDLQGGSYIYGTVEGRFPLEAGSNVQLVGFVDAGHLQRDGKPALGEPLIVGVGGGVRWTLRWLVNGTLRADVAYGLATNKWRLHLGTGQAF